MAKHFHLSPDIKQKVGEIQKEVNYIFCEACPSKGDKPFRDFDADCMRDKINLMTLLLEHSMKEGISSMTKFACSEISKKKLNPELMQAALAVILTHSKEAQDMGIVVPPLAFTAQFQVKAEVVPTEVDPGTLKGPEVLSYFREDYDLNEHHRHWHQVYPYAGIKYQKEGTKEIGYKRTIIRQGELFLYMHSQMLARYNAELLAWDMDLVHPFDYDETPLQEYVPPVTLRHKYTSRSPAGQGWYETHNPLSDTLESPPPDKSEMLKWRDNLTKALVNGYIKTDSGENYSLTADNAANVIGMITEAISKDMQYLDDERQVFPNYDDYGTLHNQGHNKFSEIGMTREENEDSAEEPYEYTFGVMGFTSVAVRDYIFWVWHRHIDDFRRNVVRKFQHSPNKNRPKAEILKLKLVPRDKSSSSLPGEIATYLGDPDPKLHEVHKKLGHEPYRWKIKVKSTRDETPSTDNPQHFTVRIFIVPKTLIQDHFAWIEMDKFTYSLDKSKDTIFRDDKDSSVAAKIGSNSSSRCSCGWPQSMMLPLGKTTGMDYVAFAILTDDELGKDPYTPALSFCGAQDDDYPDPKGMGHPFDRLWTERVTSSKTVEDIVQNMPHAKLWDFKIKRVDPPSECPENETVSTFKTWMNYLAP